MSDMIAGLTWSDALGMVGVAAYIGAYFALQAGIIRGQGYTYASLNAFAATCVLLSLVNAFNLSSAVIQVTYIGISIFGMIRFYMMSHRIRFSDEEREFLEVAAPGLGELTARKLLDKGLWTTLVAGTELTHEGETPDRLFFLLDGRADVQAGGKTIAQLNDHSLVGEMSCLTGLPASASVIVSESSRVFSIEIEPLRAFLDKHNDAKLELQAHFASQVSGKLARANSALSNASQSAA